jgi:lysophospholipase L1-like esterase
MNKSIIYISSGLIAVLILFNSCSKDTIPTLSTLPITNIKATSATAGGYITSDGGTGLIARGVCWGANINPGIYDSITRNGNNLGHFVSDINGLIAGSTYHVRAYATNYIGTGYGEDISLTTLMPVIDGNICVVGNSTISAHLGGNAVADYLKFTGNLTDISFPGSSILEQKDSWDLLSDATKLELDYVFVQIGLNDLSDVEPVTDVLARYQLLIDAINTDAPDAKLILGTMVPCRQRLLNVFGTIDGLAAYQKWLYINEAIKGNGANAVSGMDETASVHTLLLNDGNDNLAAAFDVGDGIHPNNDGRIIIARSWMTAYELLQSKTSLLVP